MEGTKITISRNGAECEAREVTDARGRKIVVRRLSALERFRFKKLIPSSIGDITFWFSQALSAASVVSIDGVPVPEPKTEGGIEAVVERLDDAGMEAIQGAVLEMLNPTLSAEDTEAAKNSPGTPSSPT